MYKDYFYLFRCCRELKEEILNYNFIEAFTQEKDVLIFRISSDGINSKYSLISTNFQFPYILMKEEFHRAKKNTISFFQSFFPSKLLNIQIGNYERAIKFVFGDFEIIFFLRGHDTNILLIKNQLIVDPFKKIIDKPKIEKMLGDISFIELEKQNFEAFPELDLTVNSNKSKYPFFSKIFFAELEASSFKKNAKEIISEILEDDITIIFNNYFNRYIFIPKTFYLNELSTYKDFFFNKYNDAIFELIKKSEADKKYFELRKKIEKYLGKELTYYSDALNRLKSRIELGANDQEYYRIGQILSTYFYQLKKNMAQIELIDLEGKPIIITLKKNLSPAENVKYFFDKAKNEKKSYERSIKLLEEYSKKKNKLLELQARISKIENHNELGQLIKEMKIDKEMNKIDDKASSQFREFLIDGKYKVLVGRNSKNNDELTLHHSNKNDYWFHARSVSGSHVVLRNDNQKDIIPKNILKSAASIAAYYSKAKTASLVPVSYTFAKYVVKRKGMEPGKVQISNENVLIVKPEIPKNCIQLGVDNEI